MAGSVKNWLSYLMLAILIVITVLVTKSLVMVEVSADADIERAKDYLIIAVAACISGVVAVTATMTLKDMLALATLSGDAVKDAQVSYCAASCLFAAVFATLAFESIHKSAARDANEGTRKECIAVLSLGYAGFIVAVVMGIMGTSPRGRAALGSPLSPRRRQ